jgi:hypothetical protein
MVDQEVVVGVRLQGQSLHMPESNTGSSIATFAMGLFIIIISSSSSKVQGKEDLQQWTQQQGGGPVITSSSSNRQRSRVQGAAQLMENISARVSRNTAAQDIKHGCRGGCWAPSINNS